MYFAHKSEDGRTQTVADHLKQVAKLAEQFASRFDMGEWGRQIGLAHDIGKYSDAFQHRLLEEGPRVDHSTAGAKEICKVAGLAAAYCVAGHHGGMPDGGSRMDAPDQGTLLARLSREIGKHLPDYSAFSSEISLKQPPVPKELCITGDGGFCYSFFIRMLFSCLVDADYLDTETFMTNGQMQRGGFDSMDVLYCKLKEYIKPWFPPVNPLNEMRCKLLNTCMEAGASPRGLYTLTIPTGGGKTVSSLAFALSHAAAHCPESPIERVIYVVPYLSIIEQNAEVFRHIVGEKNVLEHHSNVDYHDGHGAGQAIRLAAENWDVPIVVTTAVQFFESLFSNRPSRCRKLHNIANSVIILDEAQMIPVPYLLPCVRAIGELVQNYGCTAVLCTATQPSLQKLFPKEIECRELCSNPAELYEAFRRTTLNNIGPVEQEHLAELLMEREQVLCIVNTRKQAQDIYRQLKGEGNFHLSTLMCPRHRRQILHEIRSRLKANLPCRLVATSLIEAGVDVDFPAVFRQEAGLDSILQAAGRCNREGKQKAADSIVTVFSLPGAAPPAIGQNIATFHITAERFCDIASLPAIQFYFDTLHSIKGNGLDAKAIIPMLERGGRTMNFPFEQVAQAFRLIESNTRPLLIPWDKQGEGLIDQLCRGTCSRQLFRQLGQYTVNLYDGQWEQLVRYGYARQVEEGIAVLTDMDRYHSDVGVEVTIEEGTGLFL